LTRFDNDGRKARAPCAVGLLAAYNAGPASIFRARSKAAETGFDPDRWFGHVEVASARTVSREPVIYVRNIYKYYVVFRHLEALREERAELLEE
jgi:membrane-bound lytic murein transglycosylase MltF